MKKYPILKKKGFSSIYRKKGVTQLRVTPDSSIENFHDLINYTVSTYGNKAGVGN